MRRRTWNRLAGASLALCVCVLAAWALSYPTAIHSEAGTIRAYWAEPNGLAFYLRTSLRPHDRTVWHELHKAHFARAGTRLGAGDVSYRRWGVEYLAGTYPWFNEGGSGGVKYWVLIVPFRVLVLPTLLLPAAWLALRVIRVVRRARRVRVNHCVTCGYDLRASPERCPECGTAAPKPSL